MSVCAFFAKRCYPLTSRFTVPIYPNRPPSRSPQYTVTAVPGPHQVTGSQRPPDSLLGEVRQVDCEMAPPGAIVIPEVMIAVGEVDPYRQLLLLHVHSSFRRMHQEVGNKKPLVHQDGGQFRGET